jgi:hypothetical protein
MKSLHPYETCTDGGKASVVNLNPLINIYNAEIAISRINIVDISMCLLGDMTLQMGFVLHANCITGEMHNSTLVSFKHEAIAIVIE